MQSTVLLLGGNENHTGDLFKSASEMIIERVGVIVGQSSIYESPPWGFEHAHWFLNRVLLVENRLKSLALLSQIQEIEKILGRQKKATHQYEARPIDIDILFIGSGIVDLPRLTVPHPRLHLRRFTLVPLCEVMPDFIHPVMNKTMKELLEICPDKSKVQRVD